MNIRMLSLFALLSAPMIARAMYTDPVLYVITTDNVHYGLLKRYVTQLPKRETLRQSPEGFNVVPVAMAFKEVEALVAKMKAQETKK